MLWWVLRPGLEPQEEDQRFSPGKPFVYGLSFFVYERVLLTSVPNPRFLPGSREHTLGSACISTQHKNLLFPDD